MEFAYPIVVWREVLTLGIFLFVLIPTSRRICRWMSPHDPRESMGVATGILLVEFMCVAGLLEAPLVGLVIGAILLFSLASISEGDPRANSKLDSFGHRTAAH